MSNYHPEPYWSEVAKRIKSRQGQNVIAGDDEPYYIYKRQRFLEMLRTVDFSGRSVLEIGSGPGGNLNEVWKLSPAKLTGVDISNDMIELARQRVDPAIDIVKTNGTTLPFKDKTFDIVFTATVLQHNTDEEMLKKIVAEICRVSKERIYFFERIESEVKGDELCHGRPISYYADLCSQHGFNLTSEDFINIRTSYYVSGACRKLLNPKTRVEGEPLTPTSIMLQNLTLPITKQLDKIFTSRKDLAKLEFIRQ